MSGHEKRGVWDELHGHADRVLAWLDSPLCFVLAALAVAIFILVERGVL